MSQKIFKADANVRGITFGRFDGEILHFEMRPGVKSLNPPGSIGKMDIEVLFPTLSEYFESHTKYFGDMEFVLTRFKKVSLLFIKCKNIFLIISVEPRVATYPIFKKAVKIIKENLKNKN